MNLSNGQFEVRVNAEGEVRTIRLLGELDLATAPEAREVLEDAQRSEARSILVDIDGLRFIDSTGLGLLLEASRDGEIAKRVRFTRGTGRVTELLEMTGLDEALPFA